MACYTLDTPVVLSTNAALSEDRAISVDMALSTSLGSGLSLSWQNISLTQNATHVTNPLNLVLWHTTSGSYNHSSAVVWQNTSTSPFPSVLNATHVTNSPNFVLWPTTSGSHNHSSAVVWQNTSTSPLSLVPSKTSSPIDLGLLMGFATRKTFATPLVLLTIYVQAVALAF
jgi:hypothetical protein